MSVELKAAQLLLLIIVCNGCHRTQTGSLKVFLPRAELHFVALKVAEV